MDATLKTRLVLALKQAAGAARSSEAQSEANELASIVDAMPIDETAPPAPMGDGSFPDVKAADHDEIRQSVQASAALAETDVYNKVNAPSDGNEP